MVEKLPDNTGDMSSIPDLGRSHGLSSKLQSTGAVATEALSAAHSAATTEPMCSGA